MLLVYVHIPPRSKKSFLQHVQAYVVIPHVAFCLSGGKQLNCSKLMSMSFLGWNILFGFWKQFIMTKIILTKVLNHKHYLTYIRLWQIRGVSWGGFGGSGPGVTKGAPKRKIKGKERKEWERKKEKKRKRMGKEWEKERGGRKNKIKISQHDERGAMQFQAQAGALGMKSSGAPNWRRKEKKSMNIVKLISFLVSK